MSALENPLLQLGNKKADGAITENRIVKPGTSDSEVAQAAAATDALTGVSAHTAADEEVVRIVKIGRAKVEAGGTISDGDLITSDADGKAVAAAPATGVNNRIIGYADKDAVDGDIFEIVLYPSQIQGA